MDNRWGPNREIDKDDQDRLGRLWGFELKEEWWREHIERSWSLKTPRKIIVFWWRVV
eukprot:c31578_g1_i1 orf=1-168(-)